MPSKGYWETLADRRFTRRKAIAGAATLGTGAAVILAGCGGGDSKSSTQDQSGLVGTPTDTTSKAKAGGVLKSFSITDPPTFDPLSTTSGTTEVTNSGLRLSKALQVQGREVP